MISVSISKPKSQVATSFGQSGPVKFVVAIACFDHCQVMVYPLTLANGILTFGPL